SSAKPPNLLTIDGMAVATMLISIAERNIASITEPTMTRRPVCGVTAAVVAGEAAGGSGGWGAVRTTSAIGLVTSDHGLLLWMATIRVRTGYHDRRGRPRRPFSTRREARSLTMAGGWYRWVCTASVSERTSQLPIGAGRMAQHPAR